MEKLWEAALVAQQAGADDSGAGAFFGFLIICGFLWAIYKVVSRKRVYDFNLRGTARER